MLAQKKPRPGQPGTGKLTTQFGPQLICAQYQYAAPSHRRYQTTEIIIEEASWQPPIRQKAEEEVIGRGIAFRKTKIKWPQSTNQFL